MNVTVFYIVFSTRRVTDLFSFSTFVTAAGAVVTTTNPFELKAAIDQLGLINDTSTTCGADILAGIINAVGYRQVTLP